MLNALEHNNATILFADVCGYTEMCELYPMKDNVNMLNKLFTAFDSYLPEYNIEQVQIIGDAYMAISGHEYNYNDSLQATHMLRFAIDILNVAKSYNIKIRIGISHGSVISAKLGINNKITSYYGDTVNMASRMESHGYPWCIHVSQMFVDKIIEENAIDYNFVQLGYRLIKSKGRIITYLYCVNDEWKEAISYFNYKDSHMKDYKRLNYRVSFDHCNNDTRRFSSSSSSIYTNYSINDIPNKQTSFTHNEQRDSMRVLHPVYVNNMYVKAVLTIQRYWRIYKNYKWYKVL